LHKFSPNIETKATTKTVIPNRYSSIKIAITNFEKLKNKDVIHYLSYEQIFAYLFWKQMIDRSLFFVLPSSEELAAGRYNLKESTLSFPTKPFRLVETHTGRVMCGCSPEEDYFIDPAPNAPPTQQLPPLQNFIFFVRIL
jgi:hypothetical protein